MDDRAGDKHLTAEELAAYLDRTISAGRNVRVETHLTWCDDCRAELRAVGDLRRARRRGRRRRIWIGPAVAAAIVLLVAYPLTRSERTEGPVHRDAPGAVERKPEPAPAAIVRAGAGTLLRWSRVERADRYRVTLFDAAGGVFWRTETADTFVVVPDSVPTDDLGPLMWRVDARVGVDRWLPSRIESLSVPDRGPGPQGGGPDR